MTPGRDNGAHDAALLRSDEVGIATLTLNRPDRLNAINGALGEALVVELEEISTSSDIRVVIITGAGRGFCAGGDVDELSLSDDVPSEAQATRTRRQMDSVRLLHEMPQATIAAINGPCAGAGIGLAAAADLRFAASSAVFNSAFLDVALPSDYGVSWGLMRTVGPARARELLLLPGRFSAEQAERWGLVSSVVPDDDLQDASYRAATKLSGFSPQAVALMKANLNDAARHSLPVLLDLEAERVTQSQYSSETAAATRAGRP